MRSLIVLALLATLCAHARADGDQTEADKLFEEAQQLKQAGKTAEACAKYEEALAKNRNAVGTLLNVAKCNEDAGKVATAVKLYTQARDLAREHSLGEHATAAEKRLGEVSSRVPSLEVAFTERPDGMKLVIDDEVFPTDEKSVREIKLDPGTRHIVVTAPGRVPYSKNVELAEGKAHAVAIPPLDRPVTVKKARRTVGKILTVSGGVLTLTGALLGYKANVDYKSQIGGPTAGRNCTDNGKEILCNAEGYKVTGQARDLGWVGTAVGVGGVVALGIGVVLWWTAPTETVQQVSIVPSLTNESAGISAVGRF
jgi:hypothetical protein